MDSTVIASLAAATGAVLASGVGVIPTLRQSRRMGNPNGHGTMVGLLHDILDRSIRLEDSAAQTVRRLESVEARQIRHDRELAAVRLKLRDAVQQLHDRLPPA